MQIVARRPQKHANCLVIIIVRKLVLGQLFLNGTSDIEKVERTSAMISGVGDSAKNAQISASRYMVPE